MNTIKLNNLSIEYEVKGTGTPLVFLHGLGGDTSQIHSVYHPIDHIQLININLPGHGHSEADYNNYCFNSLAANVIAILQSLNIKKAYFAGISMGAAIATTIAIQYPKYVIELICIRPAWTHHAMGALVQKAYTSLATSLSRNSLDDFMNSQGFSIVNNTTNYTRNTFLHTFEEVNNLREWKKFEILPFDKPYTTISELESIDIYTTIIACKDDFVHPYEYAEEYHKHIKNSNLIEIPNKDTDPILHNQIINDVLKERLKVNP